jgi:hypothetical protein
LLLGPLLSAASGLQLKPCGGLCFVKVVPVEVLVEKAQQGPRVRGKDPQRYSLRSLCSSTDV